MLHDKIHADWLRTLQHMPPPLLSELLQEAIRVQIVENNGGAQVRVQLIGHFKPCMTDIYLHIVARMAD